MANLSGLTRAALYHGQPAPHDNLALRQIGEGFARDAKQARRSALVTSAWSMRRV